MLCGELLCVWSVIRLHGNQQIHGFAALVAVSMAKRYAAPTRAVFVCGASSREYPRQYRIRSISSSDGRRVLGSLPFGRLTVSIGFLASRDHSRTATEQALLSSDHSRRTLAGETARNRRSRHAAKWRASRSARRTAAIGSGGAAGNARAAWWCAGFCRSYQFHGRELFMIHPTKASEQTTNIATSAAIPPITYSA